MMQDPLAVILEPYAHSQQLIAEPAVTVNPKNKPKRPHPKPETLNTGIMFDVNPFERRAELKLRRWSVPNIEPSWCVGLR